ncbi:MAG: hydroxymethylglutaryl-CoA lyase [Negativicutes bacterium]|nr:hydroxymethylglutaryl-CoA lyase [Negativicutes bacterium]
MNLPKKIVICEVGPRDGLQNEKVRLAAGQKVELIELVQASGIQSIEIGSFVSSKAVPQLADTDEVAGRVKRRDDVEYRALIMNMKGLVRAAECGIKKAKLTVSASRSHSLKNANATPEQILAKFAEIMEYAVSKAITLSGAIATSFGCPFEGRITLEQILPIVAEYAKMGVREISLSDTTGMANPSQVYEYCSAVKQKFPDIQWNLHFHNTRGMGFANVLAGMQAGIDGFDASFAGLGGCPFAPGATGNIATEDLLHMCAEMGIQTGVDIDQAIATAKKVREYVGHETASFILKSGKNSDLCNLV